jgi:hypothetical protein
MTEVDLAPYITRFVSLALPLPLPSVNMSDGPTWNDRVKRAEQIALIIQRVQEDMEDRYLDLRESILEQMQQCAPSGCRVEGMRLIVPKGTNIGDFLKTFEPKL